MHDIHEIHDSCLKCAVKLDYDDFVEVLQKASGDCEIFFDYDEEKIEIDGHAIDIKLLGDKIPAWKEKASKEFIKRLLDWLLDEPDNLLKEEGIEFISQNGGGFFNRFIESEITIPDAQTLQTDNWDEVYIDGNLIDGMIRLKFTEEECCALMDVLPNTDKNRMNDVPFEITVGLLVSVRNKIIKGFKGMKLVSTPACQREMQKDLAKRIKKYGITMRR